LKIKNIVNQQERLKQRSTNEVVPATLNFDSSGMKYQNSYSNHRKSKIEDAEFTVDYAVQKLVLADQHLS